MAYEKLTTIRTNSLRGGAITVREIPLLPFGAFSAAQNVRGDHPGFRKRAGQSKLHGTADSTNEVLSLYQFSKSRVDETHFYAQMSDGDVLEADNNPPTTTTGVFGSEIFDGSAGQIPASWGNIGDKLIFSNGVDQHQIYGGNSSYITKFILYKGTATIPTIPIEGKDFTVEVTDGRTNTSADISDLDTLANFDCLFFQTPVQAKSITITMGNVNTSASVTQLNYWNGTWASVSGFSDNTTLSGASFGQDGSMTWTTPADIIPKYAFGSNGWWYQLSLSSGTLDSDTTILSIAYDSDWQSMINMWDGVPADVIEARLEDVSESQTYLYGGTSIDISLMTSSDKLNFATADPAIGFYIDPGSVPNSGTCSINDVFYWDGHSFKGIVANDGGTITDDSNGFTQPGWVTFPKPASGPEPSQFQDSLYYAFWYYITLSGGPVIDNTNIGVQYMPYFDITELGYSRSNCIWKNRAVLSFDRWGEYIYFSSSDNPYALNGSDYGIIQVGDGRSNKVVAMRKFYNELMVWQEEKGTEGGCLTLIEGYTPVTFGKLLISTKLGTMNNKSVAVVEGVLTSTATDERIKHLAFFLSRYGVCVTDGRTVEIISDDIQNYFDPRFAESIRRGYESKMWLSHDSSENVIRVGLVSGSSATNCNIFPVYDLEDKVWYFDTPAQELSCLAEVEASSGDSIVLQVGGGTDDGTVFLLNNTNDDVGTPIESFLKLEFGNIGEYITLRELLARWKATETGELYLEVIVNGVPKFRWNISSQPERYGEVVGRIRKSLGISGQQISIKIGNFERNQTMYLEDLGVEFLIWKRR
jgi:hypothetical protein